MGYHWETMNHAPFASQNGRLAAHPLLISALLFGLALLLRLLALERYVTPDELIWVYRSVLFREALAAGQWANTLVSGHPGVTTTWLGTAAISMQLALRPADQAVYAWLTQLAYLTPDNMAAYQQLAVFLDSGRTAVAIVNSLGIVAVFWLARELLDSRIALLAALILAIDPFLSGLSGLLHVDGLLTTAAILSLLALALGIGLGHTAQSRRRQLLWLALSGTAAGLAVLSKSPGLILLPAAALALASLLWRRSEDSARGRLATLLAGGLTWLGTLLLTILILFPALWSSPLNVLSTAGGNAGRHVEEALRPTFFLGDLTFDHGPGFYPVALLWRLSPLVIGGLLLLLLLLIKRPRFRDRERGIFLLLLLWVLMFLVAITFAAKKFDRYALPVVPALAVLAAMALAQWRAGVSRLLTLSILVLAVAQLAMIIPGIPYLLSAYNPLVGGPYTAQYVLPLGWGESVSASGHWLSGTPAAAQQTAVSGLAPSLAPFFSGTTLFSETSGWGEADYIILTANSRQVDPQILARADQAFDLSHTVQYGLLQQAWVYRDPDAQPLIIEPADITAPPSFGVQMQLLAQDLRTDGQDLLYTARWRKEQLAPRLIVKLRLDDDFGHTWQTSETDLLNEVYFYPQNWQPDETPQITYRLELPPAMPPGTYSLALTLVDQESGGQLPVNVSGEPGGILYDAGSIQLAWPAEVVDPGALQMTPLADAAWLDGDLRLLGTGPFTTDVQAGGEIELDLIWQAARRLPAGLQLALQLEGSEPVLRPLGSFDSGDWRAGSVLRQKYALPVPGDMAEGEYQISIVPLDSSGERLAYLSLPVARVQVGGVDRLFELPPDIEQPLAVRFEPGIILRGVSPGAINAASGDPLSFTFFWQTEVETAEPLTAFVHLLDEAGAIAAQVDRWPGGLPSDLWSQNQVIVDAYELDLPDDLAPGDYQIAAGLYTASDGLRLPAYDSGGERLADDRYVLPIMVRISE